MPFNQAAGRKEAALGGELQVASVSSLRRSDRAVILPAGPPPVLLWQPVIIHRRDALSCRFQPRCKWTQMGSDRDQANNVLFISFASFFLFFFLSALLSASSLSFLLSPPHPYHTLTHSSLRCTVENTLSIMCFETLQVICIEVKIAFH